MSVSDVPLVLDKTDVSRTVDHFWGLSMEAVATKHFGAC